MSTPRQELPRRHARTGRDLEHGDAVVRQRLRAVTGRAREDPVPVTRGGRPALAWQPVTAAFPHVEQHREGDPTGEDPGIPAEPRGPGDGWLPARPADDGVRGEDDLAVRLRSRAATTVASAYTAAHGHPTAHSGFAGLDDGGRRRWAASPRVAVAALVVVLALGAGVAVTGLRADDVEPLVPVGSPGTASEGAVDDDVAAPGAGAEENAAGAPDDPAGDVGLVPGAEAPGTGVVVHVVGQVVAPGLVTVAPDARVADALDAAGGATPDADLGALNLARTVADGEQIVVPRPGEGVAAPPGTAGPTTGGATGDGDVVDLNTADATTLDALPGIGPVLAERIVAWRDENGPYTSVDELGEVSGIGPAVLADVRDLVRV